MVKVLDKVLKYKYSIGGKQLDNWLQLEMGFKPCLQRLTRASRNYCGNPDGRVQVRLTDLGFIGDETGSRKERVECEPN